MKKVIALILALALLSTCAVALAEKNVAKTFANIKEIEGLPEIPALSSFASMKTKQRGNTITVTLNQAVDTLVANWRGYKESPEALEVSEDNIATVNTAGHKYQLGVYWTNAYVEDIDWDSYQEMIVGETDPADYAEIIAEAKAYVNAYYYCFHSCLPRFELYRISNGGDVLVKTILEKDLTEAQKKYVEEYGYPYEPPIGQYWDDWTDNEDVIGVDGEAYAWRQLFLAAYASPEDAAYSAVQGDWTVNYNRKGQIVSFFFTMEDSNIFGKGTGTAIISFQKCNTGWYIRSISETYADETIPSRIAFFSKTGNGACVFEKEF